MNSDQIRTRYLNFFEKRGHTIIPSASLVPENDPSSLFTTAGMQPLVPYLLGAKHPAGTRLVDVQKCVRTGDIEDVGDNRHLTFFEMLGNWSLGDYFKKEAIEWSLEFITSKEEGLGLDVNRLYVTVFRGEDGIPRDLDAIKYWKENFKKFGIDAEVAGDDEVIKDKVKIIPLDKENNFWIAGQTGPCGGDTEMFYDVVGNGKVEGNFQELVKSGRIIEIWNNVFMEFNKKVDGTIEKLSKPNVDTGMGLERTTVVMQGKSTVFDTDIFSDLLSYIKDNSTKFDERLARIVADHTRSSVMIISDGVNPSNTEAGYVLRRILRRTIRFIDQLGISKEKIIDLAEIVIKKLGDVYPNLIEKKTEILNTIKKEDEKFRQTLEKGLKELQRLSIGKKPSLLVLDILGNDTILKNEDLHERDKMEITGSDIFKIVTTYGLPFEVCLEELNRLLPKVFVLGNNFEITKTPLGKKIIKEFNEEMKKHQEISKAGSEQKFKGGLAGTGEQETKYHTATHLLLGALRQVLSKDIYQKGSNITADRMRFDFNYPEKVPAEKLKEVEDLVNQKIAEKIPVEMLELPKEEAKKICTVLSFDESKYGDVVKVYKIGDFDVEFCGGPHVKNTEELGHFKIVKEEASSAGVRRIKAVLQ